MSIQIKQKILYFYFKCSTTCGSGFAYRKLECFNYLTNSTSNECDDNDKPMTKINCNSGITCGVSTTTIINKTMIKSFSNGKVKNQMQYKKIMR